MKKCTPLFLLFTCLNGLFSSLYAQEKPVDLVYPMLDAAHSRWFYFSSACRPFGMVSLFPDTEIDGAWGSGYRYAVDTVRCFSHIHEWQLAGVALMPVTFDRSTLAAVLANPASHFSHEQETVRPGYHALTLDRYHIQAALTATDRAGFHRYQFPATAAAGVVLKLSGRLGPSDITEGGFKKVNDHEISGYVINGPTVRRAHACPVYFSIVFDKPIANIYLQQDNGITEQVTEWGGTGGNVLIEFAPGETLMLKAGISFVNEQGAEKNRATEIPHWNFERVVRDAHTQWNEMLSRMEVKGGTRTQRQRFYTDLWHAIQGRRIISDVDGRYADHTTKNVMIRQLPLDKHGKPTFNMYNSDAFWGAQWTLNTLWQLVYPEVADAFCSSFITYYKNGGLIPRGPSGGGYTFVMTGASFTPFLVSAWQKGLCHVDMATAYEGLKKNHLPGGMMARAGYEHHTAKGGGIEFYSEHGYVPYPLSKKSYGYHQDGAGMTLEYAYQDWALAQLAKGLGHTADYTSFMQRATHYKNLYNPATGYMQPKDSLGAWMEPFDPLAYEHGFIEGNAAHFTWFVPHDLPGLFQLMGGQDTAVARLNKQFEQAAAHRFCDEHPEEDPKYVDNKRTWINYSNQPNSEAAFIFNHAGAPALTQYWSREVVNKAFSELSPYYGYNGDEDQGLMGSLSVLMKIGLFQMTGGCEENPYYELGSPLFDEVIIHLQQPYYPGKKFVIKTLHNSDANRYIQSATFHKKPLTGVRLRHNDLVAGGTLELMMGDQPAE